MKGLAGSAAWLAIGLALVCRSEGQVGQEARAAGKATGSGSMPAAEAASPAATAESIMAAVAVNQDRAEQLRSQYTYQQYVHVATHKPRGKLVREESAEYRVTPAPDSTEKKLEQLTGRYLTKGHYVDFAGQPVPDAESVDAQLVQQFRDDLGNTKSKDGLAKDLFPLTTDEQKELVFRLVGEEMMDGRAAYRVAFRPKDRDEVAWAGEAWIDKADLEPIYVITKLSRKVPFFVRTMMGTDLPGLGFSVHYRRQSDGAWFPTSFGTEFGLRILFFLNREVSISLENRGFEHTHVQTRIEMAAPE